MKGHKPYLHFFQFTTKITTRYSTDNSKPRFVRSSVGPQFTFMAFLSILSSLPLPKWSSDLFYHCPAHPHATGVAVYSALFCYRSSSQTWWTMIAKSAVTLDQWQVRMTMNQRSSYNGSSVIYRSLRVVFPSTKRPSEGHLVHLAWLRMCEWTLLMNEWMNEWMNE